MDRCAKPKCKDIPDMPILRLLADASPWAWVRRYRDVPCILDAMPPGTPERLALAKMGMLMRRGLVDGCICGCRGDFSITHAGRAYLAAAEESADGH